RHLAQAIDAIGQIFREGRKRQRILGLAQPQDPGGDAGPARDKAQLPFLAAEAHAFEKGKLALPSFGLQSRNGVEKNGVLGAFHKARMHDRLFNREHQARYESISRQGEAMYTLIVGTKEWSSWS